MNGSEPNRFAGVEVPPEERTKMLLLIEKYAVSAVLTGHLHRNLVGEYKGIQLVTTDSTAFTFTSEDGLGYRLFGVTADTLTHEYKRID